jgi:hypothetical protein
MSATKRYNTGRCRSAAGQIFQLGTIHEEKEDVSTLCIWNEDESAVIVHHAYAFLAFTHILYLDPDTGAEHCLELGPRETAIAHLYNHRLAHAGRHQRWNANP